jgi:hypothetical protein
MRILLVGAALLAIATGSAGADQVASDCLLRKSDCRTLIGKTLWVSIPKGNEVRAEITFVHDDWSNSLKLRTGSFRITGTAKNKFDEVELTVQLPDGRTGWAGVDVLMFTAYSDPVADAKKAREDCARSGQPRIGMTESELVATCWGKPRRIVKRTTAEGVEETYIYGIGHVVTVTDGKVSAIVEAR